MPQAALLANTRTGRAATLDIAPEAIILWGHEVGLLDRQLFPGDVGVRIEGVDKAIRTTRELIANREVPAVFEGTLLQLTLWLSDVVTHLQTIGVRGHHCHIPGTNRNIARLVGLNRDGNTASFAYPCAPERDPF